MIADLPALYEDRGSRPPLPEHCELIPDWRDDIDQAVCPQRYDTEDYERIREAIGAREFSALTSKDPPDWRQHV